MRAAAPDKLLLTGAYAVLEGAPAIVVAVDRYAIADTSREQVASIEVREALRNDAGPFVDATPLHDGASKIGGLVERAAAFGQPAIGLTDHGVMNGAVELSK